MTTPQTEALPDKAAPAAPPRAIGPYRVIGRLGKGGMAEVLLTLQHDPGSGFKRLVVVKRVLTELEEEDPQFIQMFLDEARLAARLQHANVVQTYEVGTDGRSPYLAMEFLDGQSLNVLQRRAHSMGYKIPVDVALKIFCDALEGLHYAHELKDFDGKPLGVIHRDVTPSNVFVKYDGTTKLVDFGIAKSTTQREKTRAGMLKGKMAYMAPEQFRDMPITRSVDVWAMGIVIWETLAGERLFRGKNDFETVQAVMKREIPKLHAKRPDIPASVDVILGQAIERDPAKRLQTADDLKSKLEEVAFELGKPLRRTEVGKMMGELFGEAIAQNQKLVKDFLEKTSSFEANNEVIKIGSDGKIRTEEAKADSSSTDNSSTNLSGSTLTKIDPVNPVQAEEATRKAAANSSSGTNPAIKTGNTAVTQAPVGQMEEEDDEGERPAWHWIALVAVVLAAGIVVWKILA